MAKPHVSLRRAPVAGSLPATGLPVTSVEGFVGAGRSDPDGFVLQVVRIALMRVDGDTQVRVSIDEPTVAAYARMYADGQELDPPCLFFDGVHYWIGDGFHRRFAAERAKRTELVCQVKPGTQRDARWFALGANKKHGKALSPEDKRKAVRMALADPEWATKADTVIAAHTGTSHTFVAQLRAKVCPETKNAPREGHDGRVRQTPVPITDQPDFVRTGLRLALRPDSRWAKLRRDGADDERLLAAIRDRFGILGTSTGGQGEPSIWYKGGVRPELRVSPPNKRLANRNQGVLLKGAALLKAARALLGIPPAAAPPSPEEVGGIVSESQPATLQVGVVEPATASEAASTAPRSSGMTLADRAIVLRQLVRVHLGACPAAERTQLLDALEAFLVQARGQLEVRSEPPPGAREHLRSLAALRAKEGPRGGRARE